MTSRLTLFFVCLLMACQGHGRAMDFKEWSRQMQQRRIQVSAGLWDLDAGTFLEGEGMDLALVPASTTKVVSTYAMLRTWHPDKTFQTEIWGDLRAGTVQGDLVFKGGGDPFLVTERVWLMVQELRQRGVQRVTGRVRLDQSAFDDQRLGDGWGETSTNTTPVILPMSVNFNRGPAGLLKDPDPAALALLQHTLREAGIEVEGRDGGAGTPQRLVTFQSPPLRSLVDLTNKHSNNFMAEMMTKGFGGGSWQAGVRQIQEFYRVMLGLGPDKIQITDGSGLSKRNRLSARTLAIILRAAWNDFEVGPEMVASLKYIGAEDFKLKKLKDPNLARRVRCKTGHLAGVDSICGFITMPDGRRRVFAILLNGPCDFGDLEPLVSHWAN